MAIGENAHAPSQLPPSVGYEHDTTKRTERNESYKKGYQSTKKRL